MTLRVESRIFAEFPCKFDVLDLLYYAFACLAEAGLSRVKLEDNRSTLSDMRMQAWHRVFDHLKVNYDGSN